MELWEGITESHRRRGAVLYLRQSTIEQVRVNIGSTAVQMSQVDLIRRLGWPDDRIEVLSGDLGVSGTSVEGRADWQRILASITDGRIGLLCLSATSRASRNRRDFANLIYLCDLYDVILLVEGQIIDPKRPDQRLLVNIRADVDEYDNAERTRRLRAAKDALIKQGKAMSVPPVGYVVEGPKTYRWVKHPDEAVRGAIAQVFELALQGLTITRIVKRLRALGMRLPRRGPGQSVSWVETTTTRVFSLLTNPAYAGRYVFGRRRYSEQYGRHATTKSRGRLKCRLRLRHDGELMLPDHHEPYVPWEAFCTIQRMFVSRNFKTQQPPLKGAALLQGLLRCGRCGSRLLTAYYRTP